GGTVAASDGGGTPGTLSTGALASIGAANNISVTAQTSIAFADIGAFTLQTALGNSAAFTAGSGAITFSNTTNTLATSGGSMNFGAGTDLTLASFQTDGGDVVLTAGVAAAGNLSVRDVFADSRGTSLHIVGNLTMQATNAGGGTITQLGVGTVQTINAT